MKQLESIEKLTSDFEKLPGIGHKTAERLAFSIIDLDMDAVNEFSKDIISVKEKVHPCRICGMYTDNDICDICKDISNRDKTKLIVVSSSKDALAIEKTCSSYLFHILNGNISLVKNITPDKLNIESLLKRIDELGVNEVILATNPTVEGETTARYIAKLLENKNIIVTRLATGLPMGGEIDYIDPLTIGRAISGRVKIKD